MSLDLGGFGALFRRAQALLLARGIELPRGGGIDFAEVTPPPPPPPIIVAPPPVIAPPPIATPPIAPPPLTGGQILEDLLNRPHTSAPARPPTVNPDFERLLRKAPETDLERLLRGTFTPRGGNVARAAVRVAASTARILGSHAVGVLGGVLTPSPLGGDDILTPADIERIERRRRGPRTRPRTRPVGTPRGTPPPPAPEEPQPLETVVVEAPRLPTPSPRPAPGPSPRPQARPTPRPTPRPTARPTLLPYLAPLLPALFPSGGRPAPLAFSLPGGQPLPADLPLPSTPSPGLTLPQPQPLPFPLLQPPPQDPCRCTQQRRKRKPKKPREICYAGEYRERARGLIKERRRKIPCQ